MKKRYWIPIFGIAIAAAGFFGFAPGMIEASMNKVDAVPDGQTYTEAKSSESIEAKANKVDGKTLGKVSAAAIALHKTLTIVDLHSDTLLWDRDLNARASRGHVDVPRMADGNVTVQIFSSVTKTPKKQNYNSNSGDTDNITALVMAQLQPVDTWSSLRQRSLYHAQKLDAAVAASQQRLRKVTDPVALDATLLMRSKGKASAGAILSIEGLQNLEGDIKNLDVLYAAGFRMAGLAHFFDNEVAGSMHGMKKGGLTLLGRDVVKRMEAIGMIVDIAHCSRACVAEILAMARRPVVSSHGGVKGTCDNNRNLTDDEIRRLARTGGVIGIGYWEGAVCDTSPAAIAKAMVYVRDLVGIRHVALGSDYDGAVTVRFDTSKLVHVTQALMNSGFSESEIRAVMGENAVRVLRDGMRPLPMAVPEISEYPTPLPAIR